MGAQRRIPHEDKGRDWVIQQKPRNVKDCQQNYQMLGKRRHGTDSSLTALRRNQLCPHFDLGLLASRTVRR
ncbi:hypothetical protein A7M65_19550 [Acinetobacter baumannii]|nr:hypothetical protein A7M65_19550 [Acinetobacter baumannii]